MSGGTITRKDLITDEALEFGQEYAKNIKIAVDSNKELVDSAKAILTVATQYQKIMSNSDFITLKQQEALETTKAMNAIKLETEALKAAEKVKQESLKTRKLELDALAKEEAAKKRNTKLTIEERVQNEVNNRALKQAAREKLGLVGAYEKLNKARTDAKNRLRDLIAAEGESSKATIKARQEFEKLDAKVKLADRAVGDFTKNVGNYPKLNQFALAIRNLVSAFGLVGGITAFVSVVRSAINTVREYEAELVNLAAIAGKSRKDIAPLEAEIRNVAKSSINSATEVAKLTTALIKLGATPEQAIALLKPINDLSIALRADAEESAELVKGLLNAYGEDVDQAGRYTDVLAQAANKSALSFQGLRDSFSYVAPAARAMGYSIEQTAAMVSVLVDNNIKAESAGRLLRTMMGQVAKEGTTLEKQLDKIAGATDQMKTATALFGAEGSTLAIILANNRDKVAELTKEYNNANGALKELTEKQLESADAKLKILNSTWEEFILSIENGQGPISKFFITAIEGITGFIETLTLANESLDDMKEKAVNVGSLEAIKKLDKDFKKYTDNGIESQEALNLVINQANIDLQKYSKTLEKLDKDLEDYNSNSLTKFLDTQGVGRKLEVDRGRIEIAVQTQKAIIEEANKRLTGSTKEQEKEQTKTTEDELKNREKARQEYLKRLKKLEDDSFSLMKFRMEQEIEISNEIAQNDKESIETRIDAYLNAQQVEIGLAQETASQKLKAISRYNDEVRDLTDEEIRTLINGGQIKKKLTDDEVLVLEEYAAKQLKIDKTIEANKQKIVDSIIEIEKKKTDAILQQQDTELNKRLLEENKWYEEEIALLEGNQQAIEDATIDHEARILKIKEDSARKALQTQIDVQKELLKNSELSADKKAEIENKLSKLELELNQIGVNSKKESNDKKADLEEAYSEKIKELQKELQNVLVDFTNSLFNNKIANIDAELQANEEYYARQIELAGNDEAQKSLIEQEREKKREAIEKKKKKAEFQAALFNKIVTLATIASQTAMASVAALAPPPIGLGPVLGPSLLPYIITTGAIQAAIVAANPLPKYEKGTQGKPHKGGFAEVGEKRPEVILEPGRNPYVVEKPSILNLPKGTEVIPSLNEWDRMQRAAVLASLDSEANKAKNYSVSDSFNSRYDAELLEELRRNTKATKSNKTNVSIHNNIDFGHEMWKFNNIKWNS